MIKIERWIASWFDVICGLFSILTFTYYRPYWDMDVRHYFTKKRLKKKLVKCNGKIIGTKI